MIQGTRRRTAGQGDSRAAGLRPAVGSDGGQEILVDQIEERRIGLRRAATALDGSKDA